MKYLNKLKNYFIKYIVLIFVFITILPSLLEIKTVYASDFDNWDFSIVDEAGKDEDTDDAQKFTIKITDNKNGNAFLGDGKGKGEVWNVLLDRYKVFIMGIMGIATLTMVLIAMFLFTKLSATASNPQERSHTVKWIGIFLIAAGLLGSITLIFSQAYNVFN